MGDREDVDLILTVVERARAGTPLREIAGKYGVDETKIREWTDVFAGMTREQVERTRKLEIDNADLNEALFRMIDDVI